MNQHNRGHRFRRLTSMTLCGLALAAVGMGPLAAQESRPQEPPPPADNGLIHQARKLLEKARETYLKLESYQDRVAIKMNIETDDDAGMFGPDDTEQEMTLAYARPNRFVLESEGTSVHSDGRTMWFAFEMMNQYVEKDAPDTLSAFEGDGMFFSREMLTTHPALAVMLNEDDAAALGMGRIVAVSEIAAEARDGSAGRRIIGEIEPDQMMMPDLGFALPRMPFSIWLSDETGLLGQISVDMTAFYKEMSKQMEAPGMGAGGMLTFRKFEVVINLTDIKMNQPLGDEVFTFSPPEGMEKVDAFDMGGGRMVDVPDQQALVGEPAP